MNILNILRRHRLRAYCYRVAHDDLNFTITIRAPSRAGAIDQATKIGMSLGLLLVGPL